MCHDLDVGASAAPSAFVSAAAFGGYYIGNSSCIIWTLLSVVVNNGVRIFAQRSRVRPHTARAYIHTWVLLWPPVWLPAPVCGWACMAHVGGGHTVAVVMVTATAAIAPTGHLSATCRFKFKFKCSHMILCQKVPLV